jgi:hypothetical protein
MDHAGDDLPIPQRYWAILTLMVGVALSCLDTALVNVALPTAVSRHPLASSSAVAGFRDLIRRALILRSSGVEIARSGED